MITRTKAVRNIMLIAAAVLVALLATLSYLAPHHTLRSIREAAQVNDTERLRELVDFESVRALLKDDIRTMVLANAATNLEDTSFAAIAGAIVSFATDSMVDAIVSPSSLNVLLSPRNPAETPPSTTGRSSSNTSGQSQGREEPIVEGHYDGISRFKFYVRFADEKPEDAVGIFMRREGLFAWKISRVVISKNFVGKNFEPGGIRRSRESAKNIAIESSALDPEPLNPQILVVKATISQNSTSAQNYPLLELTVTDAQDKPIARRVFTAHEYLGTNEQREFSAKSKESISLRIDASALPIRSLSGYKLYVFYPSGEPERMTSQLKPEALRLLVTRSTSNGDAKTIENGGGTATMVPPDKDAEYVVQLGAFKDSADVKLLLTKLKGIGIPAYTENFDSPDGQRIRVRAGPFANQDAATRARSRLNTIGVDGPIAPK